MSNSPLLKFNTAVESQAVDKKQIPLKDGQFLILTDTRKLMYDNGASRITLGDVVELDRESDRQSLLAPINKFYFVKETGVLWRCDAGEWSKTADGKAVQMHTGSIVKSDAGAHGIRFNIKTKAIELYDSAKKTWEVMASAGASVAVKTVLSGSGWVGGRQTVAISGLTADQNGVVGLTQDISAAALEAVRAGELYVCSQAEGSLTIAADGEVPTRDIPIVVILLG